MWFFSLIGWILGLACIAALLCLAAIYVIGNLVIAYGILKAKIMKVPAQRQELSEAAKEFIRELGL